MMRSLWTGYLVALQCLLPWHLGKPREETMKRKKGEATFPPLLNSEAWLGDPDCWLNNYLFVSIPGGHEGLKHKVEHTLLWQLQCGWMDGETYTTLETLIVTFLSQPELTFPYLTRG